MKRNFVAAFESMKTNLEKDAEHLFLVHMEYGRNKCRHQNCSIMSAIE